MTWTRTNHSSTLKLISFALITVRSLLRVFALTAPFACADIYMTHSLTSLAQLYLSIITSKNLSLVLLSQIVAPYLIHFFKETFI